MIQIKCKSNSARCTNQERLTSGMVGLSCEFVFDSAWDGLTKTAVFIAGNEQRDVLLTGDTCIVPWEVLKTAGCQLYIGVYGTNATGTLVIPTIYANGGRIFLGADPNGDESTDPTLPVWAQMQSEIGNLNELETVDKSSLVAAINEAAQSGGGGGASSWDDLTDKPFNTIGENLKIVNGVLSVDTAPNVQQDNTKPITSAAVYVEVGNINALLALI